MLIPMLNVTLLSGSGGMGKSLLVLQLAACVALGLAWLGLPVITGPVIYFSAEDDLDEIHRRLIDFCNSMGVELSSLTNVHIICRAGEDAVLASPGPNGLLQVTPIYEELEQLCAKLKPVLLVLDTLADLFGGDENNRSQARQFTGKLRHLAIKYECAVVLLSHPSLSGVASGSGLSESQWRS